MNRESHSSDLFICDYAHYAETHPEYKKSGVVASVTKNDKVSSFALYNPKSLQFDFVSFDRNPALFKRSDGSLAPHCECMCEALCRNSDNKRWLLLLELKYCSPKNIKTNVEIALRQLVKSCEFLKAKQEPVVMDKIHRLYFAVSHPDNSPIDALDAFLTDPDQLMEIREQHHAGILYTNAVEIIDSKHLRALI